MRNRLGGGTAALCVGAAFIVSCGGGGAGDPSVGAGNPGVVGANGAQGGAAKNASGSSASPAAAGSTAASPGATSTTTTAPGADPTTAPGVAGTTAPAAAGTTAPAAAATTAAPAGNPGATIVPLYTYPTDPSWDTVIAAKRAHPTVGVVAVVNPANGPGPAADGAYAAGIARLNAAGVKVLGYVRTGYAVRNPPEVKADIDSWRTFYPGQLGGVFFDEQSDRAGDVGYYRDVSQYAKAQGLSFTVGNPGKDSAPEFVGALDTMLIYENAGLPTDSQMGGWHASYAPSNFGVIPHSSSFDAAFVRDARHYVQYVYVQNDTLPNPWDSVPPFFADLLAALE
jgi:hypothetical protein